jgi:NTP pyrophosphatase (non-canonical NTP hydrolase)
MEAAMDWSVLQAEQAEWSKRNFGDQPGYQMVLGMVEEVGELTEAMTMAMLEDAAGDIVVYMSGYCTTQGIRLADVFVEAERCREVAALPAFVGRLCHAHLKCEQGIRGTAEAHAAAKVQAMAGVVVRLRAELKEHASSRSLEAVVADTWAAVRQRDWQKAPANGVDAV